MGKKIRRKRRGVKPSAAARQNKMAMIGITCVVCMLFGVLLYSGHNLQQHILTNDEKQEEMTSEIEQQKQRTEEIGQLEEYMQTDEYMENTAQNKLGLLKDNEIIFKAEK